jgi:hypothetical protein
MNGDTLMAMMFKSGATYTFNTENLIEIKMTLDQIDDLAQKIIQHYAEKTTSKHSDKYSDIVSDGGMDPR